MKKYKWVNEYHNIFAYSTLNEEERKNIECEINSKQINSADMEYKRLKRLEKSLCDSKNCDCRPYQKIIN